MLALGQAEGQTFHARVAASSSSVSVDTCSSIGGCLSAPLASLRAACPACACLCHLLGSPKSRGSAAPASRYPRAAAAAPDAPAPLPPASPLPPCSPLPAASR